MMYISNEYKLGWIKGGYTFKNRSNKESCIVIREESLLNLYCETLNSLDLEYFVIRQPSMYRGEGYYKLYITNLEIINNLEINNKDTKLGFICGGLDTKVSTTYLGGWTDGRHREYYINMNFSSKAELYVLSNYLKEFNIVARVFGKKNPFSLRIYSLDNIIKVWKLPLQNTVLINAVENLIYKIFNP